MKKCKFCGVDMPGVAPNRKFCSRACREKARAQRQPTSQGALNAKCVVCGKPFHAARAYQKYCSNECNREVQKKLARERLARQKAAELEARATNQHVKTLDDWIREAAACNLDYGTYRALIAQGKTFAELKAKAERKQRI